MTDFAIVEIAFLPKLNLHRKGAKSEEEPGFSSCRREDGKGKGAESTKE